MLMISGNKLKKDAVYCQDGIKFGFKGPEHPELINTDRIVDWSYMFNISTFYQVPWVLSIGYLPILDITNGINFERASFGIFENTTQPDYLKNFPKGINFTNAFNLSKYESFFINAPLAEKIDGIITQSTVLKSAEINTPNATSAMDLASSCSELLTIDLTTGFLNKADNMFTSCSKLHTINGKLKLLEATTLSNIFSLCPSLVYVEVEGTIGKAISLLHSAVLSNTSILSICQALKDGISGTPKVTFNTALAAKATDSVKLDSGVLVFCDSADPDALGTLQQYVTAKGWILVFA